MGPAANRNRLEAFIYDIREAYVRLTGFRDRCTYNAIDDSTSGIFFSVVHVLVQNFGFKRVGDTVLREIITKVSAEHEKRQLTDLALTWYRQFKNSDRGNLDFEDAIAELQSVLANNSITIQGRIISKADLGKALDAAEYSIDELDRHNSE